MVFHIAQLDTQVSEVSQGRAMRGKRISASRQEVTHLQSEGACVFPKSRDDLLVQKVGISKCDSDGTWACSIDSES